MKLKDVLLKWAKPVGMAWASVLLFGACAYNPQKKGTVTTEMRGAQLLTDKGDQLMQTGIYSKRNVSPEFAEGYEKGLSDAYKRLYWSLQEEQRWVHFWYDTRPDNFNLHSSFGRRRAAARQISNEIDAARMAEEMQQQMIRERAVDILNDARKGAEETRRRVHY